MPVSRQRKPEWLKVKLPSGPEYARIDRYHRQQGLNSVCRSAACPNQGECWSKGTATFMILGNNCSRHCRFCNVSSDALLPPDPQEPQKVAKAIAELKLKHAVITSVTRDDLPDGGAHHFVALVEQIKQQAPDCRIELLIPDLQGDWLALQQIVESGPDIIGHNIETVSRLYAEVRPEAEYQRSLQVLAKIKQISADIISKSGLMLGMGETEEEVLQVMHDLRQQGCQILTLGQYLAPSKNHYPVQEYITPDRFKQLAEEGQKLGFEHVEAGPLVRSSYHAEEQFVAREEKV
ncbi:lipoic acid synthetase [Malonomonas rubra DSM 5091]|uniref:Lipoyl synthase n=1 Tax=Malonomonas rubra DSM 5091 TaxID=1122189 RepID=A0A1M6F6U3_MALRU|nr:lipoyl synthase [Malonomonas rubra]SHI93376.1 lipoic acid synthetase [Malonomonas rubra DSM 5091]